MEDSYMNKLRSYVSTEVILKANKPLIISNPKFTAKIDALSLTISALRIKDAQQATSTTGKTDARDVSKNELVDALKAGIGALYVMAADTHNEALKAIASVQENEISHKWKLEELNNQTAFFIDMLEANILTLPEHGYTQEDLDELKAKHEAYSASQGSTYQGMALQKAATATIPELISEADDHLETLDRYVDIEAKRHPDFAREYWATRVIKDLGVRHEEKTETQPAEQPA